MSLWKKSCSCDECCAWDDGCTYIVSQILRARYFHNYKFILYKAESVSLICSDLNLFFQDKFETIFLTGYENIHTRQFKPFLSTWGGRPLFLLLLLLILFCVAKQYENISIRQAIKNPVLILSLESFEFWQVSMDVAFFKFCG